MVACTCGGRGGREGGKEGRRKGRRDEGSEQGQDMCCKECICVFTLLIKLQYVVRLALLAF